jgi:hypothetical protein
MEEGKRETGRWREIRAALLLVHVVAIVLMSLPGELKLGDPARWKDLRTQAQLKLWAGRLRGWGWEMSDEAFEARLWSLTQRYLGARQAIVTPFLPYGQVAPQGWGMFKAPPLEPSAIVIEVREKRSPWRTLYASRSPEHAWQSRLLDHNRFRKQIGRVGGDPTLLRWVAHWLAKRVFDEFPEVTEVRVRVERITSLPPERVRAGEVPPRKTERQERVRRGMLL